jgi:glutamate-1-semialdehyde 2,1-aminomutase/spore coat polysaccharide biosynthesis protein SpsF
MVVCAVPDEEASKPLEYVAQHCGAKIFRGPEADVLKRYAGAARAVGANTVMRVTSDCPLIDPGICGDVLALRAERGADYAANDMPASFPHGLNCEAFTAEVLEIANARADSSYDREHVTPWMRRTPQLKRANLASGEAALAHHRWTLDYPEDLAFFRAIFAALPAGSPARMVDVLAAIAADPSLSDINVSRRDTATA